MEEFAKQDEQSVDSPGDMGDFFFKSLNDFILFTSGYHYMVEHPPKGNFPILDNPDFIVEVASLQTAGISFVTSLFQGKLMVPALAIEYFLNNRIQAEMIFNLLKSKEIIPDEESFLRCLSGIDSDNTSFLEVNDKVVNGLLTTSSLVARDTLYMGIAHLLEKTHVGQFSITQAFLNTILSAITSYIETRSIALATKNIYNLEQGI